MTGSPSPNDDSADQHYYEKQKLNEEQLATLHRGLEIALGDEVDPDMVNFIKVMVENQKKLALIEKELRDVTLGAIPAVLECICSIQPAGNALSRSGALSAGRKTRENLAFERLSQKRKTTQDDQQRGDERRDKGNDRKGRGVDRRGGEGRRGGRGNDRRGGRDSRGEGENYQRRDGRREEMPRGNYRDDRSRGSSRDDRGRGDRVTSTGDARMNSGWQRGRGGGWDGPRNGGRFDNRGGGRPGPRGRGPGGPHGRIPLEEGRREGQESFGFREGRFDEVPMQGSRGRPNEGSFSGFRGGPPGRARFNRDYGGRMEGRGGRFPQQHDYGRPAKMARTEDDSAPDINGGQEDHYPQYSTHSTFRGRGRRGRFHHPSPIVNQRGGRGGRFSSYDQVKTMMAAKQWVRKKEESNDEPKQDDAT